MVLTPVLFAAVVAASRYDGAPIRSLVIPAGSVVRPLAARPGRSVAAWLRVAGAEAAINGGYFNHSDGWPVSHVVADGRTLTDPEHNRALAENPRLKPFLPVILAGRSAWFTSAAGWTIAPWNAPPAGWTAGLQAGPALHLRGALAAEAFRTPGRDGIASQARAARSGLGLRPDGAMVWAVATAPGLTIAGLADLLASLGCDRALALDGGSSTSLAWRDGGRLHQVGGTARVNSVLAWLR